MEDGSSRVTSQTPRINGFTSELRQKSDSQQIILMSRFELFVITPQAWKPSQNFNILTEVRSVGDSVCTTWNGPNESTLHVQCCQCGVRWYGMRLLSRSESSNSKYHCPVLTLRLVACHEYPKGQQQQSYKSASSSTHRLQSTHIALRVACWQ